MKKRDFILIGAVLVLAFLCWVVPRAAGIFAGEDASRVRITVGGEEYGTYSLSEDQIIEINDTNVCEIKDGEVNMIQADCPDQLCIHQGPIHIQGRLSSASLIAWWWKLPEMIKTNSWTALCSNRRKE